MQVAEWGFEQTLYQLYLHLEGMAREVQNKL